MGNNQNKVKDSQIREKLGVLKMSLKKRNVYFPANDFDKIIMYSIRNS